MVRKALTTMGWTRKEDMAAALPFYFFLTGVIAWMYVVILRNDSALEGMTERLVFTILMLAHLVLHWFSGRAALESYQRNNRWPLALYFVVQGLLIFALGLMTTRQDFVISLYVATASEAAALLWSNLRAIALVTVFFLGMVALNFLLVWDMSQFVSSLPTFLGITVFVLTFVILYVRQVMAREEAQFLLRDLEQAHGQLRAYSDQVEAYSSRVEELTISQERQRMARELHDTMAQGLAGLIMQLEAADSHLDNHNPGRAQEVVQQATERARLTLREARRAIQSLRASALERETLVDALSHEVDSFAASAGVQARFEVDAGPLEISPEAAQNVLRFVQAALSNVARHADAGSVLVRLTRHGGGLEVMVQDDGAGFDVDEGLGRPGRFGLAGMQERAQRLKAEMQVESEPRQGTRVILTLPAEEETGQP